MKNKGKKELNNNVKQDNNYSNLEERLRDFDNNWKKQTTISLTNLVPKTIKLKNNPNNLHQKELKKLQIDKKNVEEALLNSLIKSDFTNQVETKEIANKYLYELDSRLPIINVRRIGSMFKGMEDISYDQLDYYRRSKNPNLEKIKETELILSFFKDLKILTMSFELLLDEKAVIKDKITKRSDIKIKQNFRLVKDQFYLLKTTDITDKIKLYWYDEYNDLSTDSRNHIGFFEILYKSDKGLSFEIENEKFNNPDRKYHVLRFFMNDYKINKDKVIIFNNIFYRIFTKKEIDEIYSMKEDEFINCGFTKEQAHFLSFYNSQSENSNYNFSDEEKKIIDSLKMSLDDSFNLYYGTTAYNKHLAEDAGLPVYDISLNRGFTPYNSVEVRDSLYKKDYLDFHSLRFSRNVIKEIYTHLLPKIKKLY